MTEKIRSISTDRVVSQVYGRYNHLQIEPQFTKTCGEGKHKESVILVHDNSNYNVINNHSRSSSSQQGSIASNPAYGAQLY